MNRKVIVCLLTTALLSIVPFVEAQPVKKMPRIGWLSAGSSSAEFPEKQALEGLRGLGWAEGKNVVIEYRYAGGRNSQSVFNRKSKIQNLK